MSPGLVEALDTGGWRRPHIIISMGKGGVGKTTVSIRLAVELARMGRRVLVASLDPAGHLLEYLRLPRPLVEASVAPGITAVQYTVEGLSRRVAEEYASMIRRLMPGLTALGSIEDVAKAVRESPGFEEEVFLRILTGLYERSDHDVIVVDTPPTGVSLRVLRLPRLYLFWIKQLQALRERIIATRYAIARALGRSEDLARGDPVLERLKALGERYRRLAGEIADPSRTSIVVVATPEPLPAYEAEVVARETREIGARLRLIVVNRVLGSRAESLGTSGVERESIGRLRRIRCSVEPPAGLALIAHSSRPPSSLGDVEALDGLIRVEAREAQPCTGEEK